MAKSKSIVPSMAHHHPEKVCRDDPHPCCIHSPSKHHMADWDLSWRPDEGMMERICPHGVGHPDPDHVAYMERKHPGKLDGYAHSCDRCCKPPGERNTAEVQEEYDFSEAEKVADNRTTQYHPWQGMGITEAEYWKKRYLEQRLRMGHIAGRMSELATVAKGIADWINDEGELPERDGD